jgi:multidrug efflux system membrane fusion protein
VNVVRAIATDVPVYLDEIGKTSASEMVTVMPQVSGRIEALHFADGADVRQDRDLVIAPFFKLHVPGDVLFTIDARPFTAALAQAKGQLAKDQATSDNAEAFFIKQSDVYKQKFISDSDYDTAKFNALSARAAVEADKAAVEAARLNVEYCTIKAPIDGRAGMRLVDPNNIVKINETALLVIQRLDPIYADFTINERDLSDVRAHMADHTLKTLVRLPTDSDMNSGREGDLTFLDNAVQDASGTIKLRATLPNKDRRFWPGQFVNVRLIKTMQKNAVLVPLNAPQIGQEGSYIYVVKPDSTAEQRHVVLGQQQVIGPQRDNFVVVTEGVKVGEQVVVNGQVMLFPGAPVKVEAPKAEAAATPKEDPTVKPEKEGDGDPTTEAQPVTPTTLPAHSEPAASGSGVSDLVGSAPRTVFSRAKATVRGADPATSAASRARLNVGWAYSPTIVSCRAAQWWASAPTLRSSSRFGRFAHFLASPLTLTLSPEYRGEGTRQLDRIATRMTPTPIVSGGLS